MPLDKSMSFSEIVKKEMAAGKDQKQAVAIAYSVKGESKENKEIGEAMLTGTYNARDRFDSLDMRAQRGTERYASKRNEDENIEDQGKIKREPQVTFKNSITPEIEKYLESQEGKQLVGSVSALAKKFGLSDKEANDIVLEWTGFSKKNEDDYNYFGQDGVKKGLSPNYDKLAPGRYDKDGNKIEEENSKKNEDSASQEEHEIQKAELERKKDKQSSADKKNTVTVKVVKNKNVYAKYLIKRREDEDTPYSKSVGQEWWEYEWSDGTKGLGALYRSQIDKMEKK